MLFRSKLPLEESNRLCKEIPDRLPDGLKMNLTNAIKCVPALQEAETAVTTRGMGSEEMVLIADAIDRVLSSPEDENERTSTRSRIAELGRAFPLYESL